MSELIALALSRIQKTISVNSFLAGISLQLPPLKRGGSVLGRPTRRSYRLKYHHRYRVDCSSSKECRHQPKTQRLHLQIPYLACQKGPLSRPTRSAQGICGGARARWPEMWPFRSGVQKSALQVISRHFGAARSGASGKKPAVSAFAVGSGSDRASMRPACSTSIRPRTGTCDWPSDPVPAEWTCACPSPVKVSIKTRKGTRKRMSAELHIGVLNLCVIFKACPSDFTTQHGNLRMPRYPWPHGV